MKHTKQIKLNQPLISQPELAKLLGVGVRCIQIWERQGKINGISISRRCKRYSLAQVEQDLARCIKSDNQ